MFLSFLDCPANYFLYNGNCYGLKTDPDELVDWTDARGWCQGEDSGYNLVVIDDNQENEFLQDQIKNLFPGYGFWIGLKENSDKNGFIWLDGSSLSFQSAWGSGEPSGV